MADLDDYKKGADRNIRRFPIDKEPRRRGGDEDLKAALIELLERDEDLRDEIRQVIVQSDILPDVIKSRHTDFTDGIEVDTISEITADNGVAIDGLTLKDGGFGLGSDAQGDVYYRSDSGLARLGAGTSGQFLQTQGASANPQWADANSSTTAKARAYRATSNQSIGDASYTKVQLNAETYDPGNNFDSTTNYRFTVPTTGYYLVIGSVFFASMADAARVIVAIYKGGAEVSNNLGTTGKATDSSMQVSDILYLSADNYLELYVYQQSGGAKNLSPSQTRNYMSVHLLST